MELTNGLNKRVVEIYRGGELVWERPTVLVAADNIITGKRTINISTYPTGCRVLIVVKNNQTNKHEERKIIGFGLQQRLSLKSPLESGDYVEIKVEHDGWLGASLYQDVY